MGCGGSKKAAAPAEAPKQKTLLDASAEKQVAENDTVSMFLDCIGSSECLKVSDDSKLKVVDVQGGPIGGWNNRAYTDKIRVGDIVLKMRKVGANDWISDAAQMLEALRKQGPFEVAVGRGKQQAQEDPAPKEAAAAVAPVAAAPDAEQQKSEPATDAQAQNEDKSAVQADSANTEAATATDAPDAPEELAVEISEGKLAPNKACGGFFGVC